MVPTPKAPRRRAQAPLLPALLSIVGLALLGFGTYVHLSVASKTHCDGCKPWHPLFVLAPLVVGVAVLAVGGVLFARR